MALNLQCVGLTTSVSEYKYTWKEPVLYALGIGAKAAELDYLYEGRGPRVYPSFAVVPVYPSLMEALAATEGSITKIVHGHQKVTLHAPIPPSGVLRSTATVQAIYDLKKMAQAVIVTRTTDESGTPLFDTEWGILYLGEGGFDGEPPPGRETSAPSRAPDWRVEETSSPEQALLYRLMGDYNPLHADPEFPLVARFQGRPILHGLCTYGYMTRAVVQKACGGDAARLRHVSARFSKPVWPGDTLITEGWVEGHRVWARTSTRESNEAVLTHVYAELHNTNS